jgi:hypothetical protein
MDIAKKCLRPFYSRLLIIKTYPYPHHLITTQLPTYFTSHHYLPPNTTSPSPTSKMYFTSTTALFLAATAVSALPSSLSKRVDAIPLAIYSGLGCNSNPTPLTTAFVPTDGACFGISPIVSGNTDSGLIDQTLLKSLPKGCTRKLLLSIGFDLEAGAWANEGGHSGCVL